MSNGNNVVDILKGVVGELKEVANSETVIGDPVTVGDRTVIPVMKISFGFGAGGGQGEESGKAGFGGGGGGGARIEPAAFIIMDEKGVSLLPAAKGKWDSLIDTIPGIAKKLSALRDKFKSEDDENKSEDKGEGKPEEKDKGEHHGDREGAE